MGARQLYLPDDKLTNDLLDQSRELASLSFDKDDELEESVAIYGMITKVRRLHEEALVLLVQRMGHLIKAKPINDFNNPLTQSRSAKLLKSHAPILRSIFERLVNISLLIA